MIRIILYKCNKKLEYVNYHFLLSISDSHLLRMKSTSGEGQQNEQEVDVSELLADIIFSF